MAQPCATPNSTDKPAPFFIDKTGLAFGTKPPTRDPRSANYPRATKLPDAYTQLVGRGMLPLVERNASVKLTKNPDGRATLGLGSNGAAAARWAWFHPELCRRVLAHGARMRAIATGAARS